MPRDADFAAASPEIIAELTRLLSENEQLRGLLIDALKQMKEIEQMLIKAIDKDSRSSTQEHMP
jgi:hypothetical protein